MKAVGIIFSNIHDKLLPELTSNRTLASVPFAGRYRLIDFVLSNMVNSSITKVGVITKMNYQSLMDHVGSGKHWDLSRKNGGLMVLPPFGVNDSGPYKSRFEAIKNIQTFLQRSDETYVVMSDCDTVCSINYAEVISQHIEKNADITMVVYKRKLKSGKNETVATVNKEGRVTAVKTSTRLTGEGLAFSNMLVMNRQFLLNLIDDADELGYSSFSQDVLVKGAKEYRVFAYEYKGYYAEIDNLGDYYARSMELLDKTNRDALFYNEGANIYTKVRDSAPCRLGETAEVKNSIVADGCVIEGTVENSILFRGVKVAKGAYVKDSIVFQDCTIGVDSTLNCVIADKQAVILDKRQLSGHCTHPYFIAKRTVI